MWYGSTLVRSGEMSAGDVLIVFFAVITGAMSLGQAVPSLTAMASGRGAATEIFKVIERTPAIDSLSEEGLRPEAVEGEIRLDNVHFTYPTRPDEKILNGMSFTVKPRETVRGRDGEGVGEIGEAILFCTQRRVLLLLPLCPHAPCQFCCQVALVGSSGCGKSTAMALVERFYDVDAGTVQLDGNAGDDLKKCL